MDGMTAAGSQRLRRPFSSIFYSLVEQSVLILWLKFIDWPVEDQPLCDPSIPPYISAFVRLRALKVRPQRQTPY